jgi:hypothetical protein
MSEAYRYGDTYCSLFAALYVFLDESLISGIVVFGCLMKNFGCIPGQGSAQTSEICIVESNQVVSHDENRELSSDEPLSSTVRYIKVSRGRQNSAMFHCPLHILGLLSYSVSIVGPWPSETTPFDIAFPVLRGDAQSRLWWVTQSFGRIFPTINIFNPLSPHVRSNILCPTPTLRMSYFRLFSLRYRYWRLSKWPDDQVKPISAKPPRAELG